MKMMGLNYMMEIEEWLERNPQIIKLETIVSDRSFEYIIENDCVLYQIYYSDMMERPIERRI